MSKVDLNKLLRFWHTRARDCASAADRTEGERKIRAQSRAQVYRECHDELLAVMERENG